MRISVLELFVWMTLAAIMAGAWRASRTVGMFLFLILLLVFLSRLETAAPQYIVVGFAVLVCILLILAGTLLRIG